MRRRTFVALLLGAGATFTSLAAFGDDVAKPIRIGVLNDQNGYQSSITGKGSVIAAQLAVEDFGGAVNGRKVEVIFADHQNKPDVGAGIARKWYDSEGVDAVVDVPNSAVGLAVVEITRQANKTLLLTSASSSDITGKSCSPNTVQWAQDSYEVAHGGPSSILKQGGDTWFFITIDYAFGHATERDTTAVIQSSGGKVLGGVRHPPNTGDFSSYLLQAQASGAKIIGIASAGDDMANAIKQAQEFGLTAAGQKIALLTPAVFNFVHGLGLKTSQNLLLTETVYWDLNDKTRAFAKRFQERDGAMPSAMQMDVYSVVLHYLRSLKASNVDPDNGLEVVKAMRALPGDSYGSPATIREDGRVVRNLYLFQVKTPEESKGEWDIYKLVKEVPAVDVVHPLSHDCALVTN
jgi:branched-chain amino acid transport system substrate-binding protein